MPRDHVVVRILSDNCPAFTRSTSRDEKSTGAPTANNKDSNNNSSNTNNNNGNSGNQNEPISDTNTLSLSGLLNSLDGVAAAEGRLLFAYVN